MVFTLEEGQLKIEGQKNRGVRWTTSGPLLVRLTTNGKFTVDHCWSVLPQTENSGTSWRGR